MKKKHLLIIAVIAVVVTAGFFSNFNPFQEAKYNPRTEFKVENESGYRGAQEWLNSRRVDINGNINIKDVQRAYDEVMASSRNKSTNSSEFTWEEMGPDNFGGRVRAVIYDKNNPNIMFAGGVSGGLWRTTTGGLSWNRVNYAYDDSLSGGVTNLNVSCITQAANGDIYFGTGEFTGSTANFLGYNGQGIWKSTDGITFRRLANTYTTGEQKDIFRSVQRLAADPVDSLKLYAATFKGLRVTTDGGASWETIPAGIGIGDKYKISLDVKVGNDGSVVAAINNKTYISAANGLSFNSLPSYPVRSDTIINGYNYEGRLEFAISPSNPDYIYCQSAKGTGKLHNIYQSNNHGQTWTVIGPGGYLTFQPLGTQGVYDNTIAVFPDNPEKIVTGGTESMYIWSPQTEWETISYGYYDESDFRYVHPDHHVIIFHPAHKTSPTDSTGNRTFVVGTDGGVYISKDDGISFNNLNKNLNIAQFYAIGYDGNGHVVGGTQDNGTLYNDLGGNTKRNFIHINGGDGGASELSKLDPRVTFATIYYGALKRSQEKGTNMSQTGSYFYNNKILNMYFGGLEENITDYPAGPFVTQFKLWESYNDPKSIDSVYFMNDTVIVAEVEYDNYYAGLQALYNNFNVDTTQYVNANNETFVIVALTISAGETVTAKSQIYNRPIPYVLTSTLYPGEQVQIKDPYQAMLAIPLVNPATHKWNIHVTRKPLNFNVLSAYQPWAYILDKDTSGNFRDLEFSMDGNYLYYAIGNILYRVSNLSNARTQAQMDFDGADYNLEVDSLYSFSGYINDIACDPNDPDKVLVSLSGFNNNSVFYSINATSSSPSFQNKQGSNPTKLPGMPVFTGMINVLDGTQVLVGTEFGVWSTDDITAINPVWTDQSSGTDGIGMGHVITTDIRQQLFPNFWQSNIYNHGIVYIGTHGRGIFSSDAWKGPEGIDEPTVNIASVNAKIKIYPNPVTTSATIDFTLNKASNVTINVYDLQGRLVIQNNAGNLISGNQKLNMDFSELKPGTYIVSVVSQGKNASAKIMVY